MLPSQKAHGQNWKSSPKAMAPYMTFSSISLQRDHTALKQSDLHCQEKNFILLEEQWWEAIGGNLCCHRMALVQQEMLVGQRCPEPLRTDRQSCLGPITTGTTGLGMAHPAGVDLDSAWHITPATEHLCIPHPACWNEGLSWKKAIFYVTEQAKEHKCVRFKQVFP